MVDSSLSMQTRDADVVVFVTVKYRTDKTEEHTDRE